MTKARLVYKSTVCRLFAIGDHSSLYANLRAKNALSSRSFPKSQIRFIRALIREKPRHLKVFGYNKAIMRIG